MPVWSRYPDPRRHDADDRDLADDRVVFGRATQVVCTGVRPVHRMTTDAALTLRLTRRPPGCTATRCRRGGSPRGVASRQRRVAHGRDRRARRRRGVFDLSEPTTHHFFANGVLVHNCGEQPLLPFESCTLGSIDVGRFVGGEGAARDLDWARLRDVIHDAVRFLDDVIEANRYPCPRSARDELDLRRRDQATRKMGSDHGLGRRARRPRDRV